MDLWFACPQCGAGNAVNKAEESNVVSCSACDYVGLLSPDWTDRGRVERCPICGNDQFFRRRDYHQKLLIFILLGGAALALFTRYVSLLVAGVVALSVYLTSASMIVCYGCGTHVRGQKRSSGHGRYDPRIADRLRKERADRR